MPIYCYKAEDGEIYDWKFPAGEAPEEVMLLNGSIAIRDYQAEGVSGSVLKTNNPIKVRPGKPWPMKPCFASGVHASQAPELRKHFKQHGLNIEVTEDGDPIYESAVQRKKALKCRGMYDKASYC